MTVAVACPSDGDLKRWLVEAGIDHLEWRSMRSPGPASIPETSALRRLVKTFRPDVLHLHSSKAGLAGRLGPKLAPVVVFQPHAWSFDASRGLLHTASLLWERRAARRADAVICVSEAERDDAIRLGVRARLRVIRNGIDLDEWPPATDVEKAQARSALGLAEGPLAVCIGRLSEQKGQDVLLTAWTAVRSQVRDARLVLVGDGPLRESLAARATPEVSVIGRSSEVSSWLAAADVVAMPSRWEGMSLSMLEAMSRERSIVATDVAGVREAIGNDAGAIVPVGDVAALAHEIAARLADPVLATREGRRGRARVEQHFDLRSTTTAVARLYDELVGQPNR